LIILDMVMPDLDGLTFLEQLPRTCTLPLPPVIANSGIDAFATAARESGAGVFLPKPVDISTLLEAVRMVLAVTPGDLAA
jgi:DNA-binding response OmpR family regulator